VKQTHNTDAQPWWQTELRAIEARQHSYLNARLPALGADHDNLVDAMVENLTKYINQHRDSFPESWFRAGPPANAFTDLVNDNYSPSRRDFRILAVHHPVHYPPPRPSVSMSMKNDRDVAKALDTPTSGGAYPLAHLIISGHTHFFYPQHGALPPQPSLCLQPHLGDEQCQFVVGTLMQLDKYNKRAQWPHQSEVLRLYYSPNNDSVLLLERYLVARRAGRKYPGTGLGPYGFVMLPNSRMEEEITFTLN